MHQDDKSQILKGILKFVTPVMHFHFCQKYECLGAKNVVLHRRKAQCPFWSGHCVQSALTGLRPECGALLPSGSGHNYNVPPTNTGEAATIRHSPARRTSWAISINGYLLIPKGSIPPQFPKCSVFPPPPPRLVNSPLGGHVAPG